MKETSDSLIAYWCQLNLGASPILALKNCILLEMHFIGKTEGAEIKSQAPIPTNSVQWSQDSLPNDPAPEPTL